MGPKKAKAKEKPDSQFQKCQYYDRGFCNKGNECTKYHSDKVCQDLNCFEDNCMDRHPNPCKFGNRCKFHRKNLCLYSHVTIVSDDEKFKALQNKLDKKFETQCKEMKKTVEKIITEKEKLIDNLRKDLNAKSAQINALEL